MNVVDEISNLVNQLNSLEELKAVNILVNHRWGEMQRKATYRFNVGESVEWDCKRGTIEKGKITKVNQKSVSVITERGERWNVGPSFLRKI